MPRKTFMSPKILSLFEKYTIVFRSLFRLEIHLAGRLDFNISTVHKFRVITQIYTQRNEHTTKVKIQV